MPAADRSNARTEWTRRALGRNDAELTPASADASFRSYWRVIDGERAWIVMDAPPEHEDIRPWLGVGTRLAAAGLHVPQVRQADAELGFVLMRDLGNALLLPALNEQSVDSLYGGALEALLRMQTHADASGLPLYDETRLVTEMELMPTWFLQRHLGITPECEQWDTIESAFRALLNNAAEQPQVFVHRDYHSRNLMIGTGHDPGIIDFQDAVRGPLTYDLASLLRDCYIAWPDARVYAWVEGYRQRAQAAGLSDVNGATFRRWFDLMGLQRHLKVLGIFCRLWYRDGKRGYLNDLPLVWRYARNVGQQYQATAPLIALLERAIGSRDLSRPREQTS